MGSKKSATNASPIGDRLLTLREAAEVLHLSTRTVVSEQEVTIEHLQNHISSQYRT